MMEVFAGADSWERQLSPGETTQPAPLQRAPDTQGVCWVLASRVLLLGKDGCFLLPLQTVSK